MKCIKFVSLISCIIVMSSCTFWQTYKTMKVIVEEYPQDNLLEEYAEEHLEKYLDVPDGSIDLSPFSPESEKA